MTDKNSQKKPGFFKKLFSSKSRDGETNDEKGNRSPSTSPTDGGESSLLKEKGKAGGSGGQKKPAVIPAVKVDPPPDEQKSPTKKSTSKTGTAAKPKKSPQGQVKVQRATATESSKQRRQLSRKKAKKGGTKGDVAPAAANQRLEFPTTPEMILAIHKRKPFLDKNEEWLVVELNEFECLVENLDIIKTIAQHSKFFEVEPDELWEEFFEYVEEMPSYDEVINYDVWQEFRDERYPC